jgi:superfamily I DNA/RNA helicase
MLKSEGVRIMTFASSKGLTVEGAILCGLEAGLVPMDGADLAEERRLLYVGMTRAKKFLYGTWARTRRGRLRALAAEKLVSEDGLARYSIMDLLHRSTALDFSANDARSNDTVCTASPQGTGPY